MSTSTATLPTQVSSQATLAALLVSVIVPTLVVVARIWGTYSTTKRLLIDDYLAVIAIICLYAEAGIYYTDRVVLNEPTTTIEFIGNFIVAAGFVALCAIYIVRLPIIALYLRLFGVKRWVRLTCYILLIVFLLVLVAGFIYTAVVCSPGGHDLTAEWIESCIDDGLKVGVLNGSFSTLSDLVLFILPLPIIFKLQMPLTEKFSLAAVFMTAILGIAASAVTLYYRGTSLAGDHDNEIGQILGQVVEHSITIIVGSAPALRALWIAQVIKKGLYSKIQSAFRSSKSTQPQSFPTATNSAKNLKNASGDSTDHIVGMTDDYFELKETQFQKDNHQQISEASQDV